MNRTSLRAIVVGAAAGSVVSWYWLPWFTAGGETFGGSEAFAHDKMLFLGTLVSLGELGVLAALIAGLCALSGDRFGAVMSFLAFMPIYLAVKYSFFSTPAGLPEDATSAWGLWILIPLALAMAIAGLELESRDDEHQRHDGPQADPPDGESDTDYKPWRI